MSLSGFFKCPLLAVLLLFPAPPICAQPVAPDLDGYRASYLGGTDGSDTLRDVAFDAQGNLYAVGGAGSLDLQTTDGSSVDPGSNRANFGAHDALVAKFDPQGNLLWLTVVGGRGYDRAYAVEADDTGVVVAGRGGIGFPTTPGALQPSFAGDTNPNPAYGPQDGFIFKLSPDGQTMLWSTYFGDASRGFIRDVDLDASGNVYIVEPQVSAVNPHVTAGAFQSVLPPNENAVIAKIAPDGGSVEWASYLGASGDDVDNGTVRVGRGGEVYVLGDTDSDDFPVTPGASQPTRSGSLDLAFAAFAPDGASLVFATYVGGNGIEVAETHGLAIGSLGVYICGFTTSTDLPTTPDVVQQFSGGNGDPFVALYATDGTHLATTYFGGTDNDGCEGVATASDGSVAFTGATKSTDFPLTVPTTGSGGRDLFVARLSPALDEILESSFFGGSLMDGGRSAAAGPGGLLAFGGNTKSNDFPVTDSSTFGANFDGIVVSITSMPEPQSSSVLALLTLAALRRVRPGPRRRSKSRSLGSR